MFNLYCSLLNLWVVNRSFLSLVRLCVCFCLHAAPTVRFESVVFELTTYKTGEPGESLANFNDICLNIFQPGIMLSSSLCSVQIRLIQSPPGSVPPWRMPVNCKYVQFLVGYLSRQNRGVITSLSFCVKWFWATGIILMSCGQISESHVRYYHRC